MIEGIKELREKLESEIKEASKVFVIGHNDPDIDSVASAVALAYLAQSYGKEAYVVIEEDDIKIESRLKAVIDQCKEPYHIIRKRDYLDLADKKSLLILTDVNKQERIRVGDSLDRIGRTMIIDHHNEGETTVPASEKFISLASSSASEIMTRVFLNGKIPIPKDIANYLLAGIYVDSKNFEFNTTETTHEMRKKLLKMGANPELANDFLKEEFETYCRVKDLVINGTIFKKYFDSIQAPVNAAFTLNRKKPKQIYLKDDLAKAANDLISLSGVNVGFAIGYVEPGVINISARSGKRVNVEAVMDAMGGGGNAQLAGGRFTTDDIFALENELMGKVPCGIIEEDQDTPPQMEKTPKK